MGEDQTIEMAGAIVFLLAALVCLAAVRKGAGFLAVFVGILCTVAFLDEMSFGERHFGFTAPEVEGVKIDAVHDLLSLSWRVIGHGKLYFVIAVIISVLVLIASIYLIRNSRRVRLLISSPAAPVVAASLSLIMVAQFLDFGFGRFVLLKTVGAEGLALVQRSMFEEAAEFMAALLLLGASLQLFWAQRGAASSGSTVAAGKHPPSAS